MGRPLGALKGRTEQANEFARWLRKVTTGVTVRTLEEDFPYAKSSWSGFRDGSRLPPADLVEKVVARYLREPAMRQRQCTHGLELLEAAQQAAKALDNSQPLSVPLIMNRRAGDPLTEALLRLDDARIRQIEAMQKLAASERRREHLESMVSVLEERITVLESERDRAREEIHEELQRELQTSLEYRRQADEKLRHARRAEDRAYQLRLAAENQVTRQRMALLQMEQDAGEDTVLPPAPGQSVAEGLNLPPLHQIHQFLQVAQEQLDAQDDELDDLGEQIGVEAEQAAGDGDPLATRIVQGHVVDSANAIAPDVPGILLDNSEQPVTSGNGTGIPGASTTAGPDSAESFPRPDAAEGQPIELVNGLEKVSTPADLSSALVRLRKRAGVRSIRNLTAVFPPSMKDDLLVAAAMRWIDGDALPDTWPHLETLVRAMGATDREVNAFHQAYTRTVSSLPPGPDGTADLADLESAAPNIFSRHNASPLRLRHWITVALGPMTVATLTTGYTAGLQASPSPGLWRLVGYGAAVLAACLSVLIVAARAAKISTSAGTRRPLPGRRPAIVSLRLTAMAIPAGLVIPWLLHSDVAGRWFANLIGLV